MELPTFGRVRERVAACREAGVTTPDVTPPAPTPPAWSRR